MQTPTVISALTIAGSDSGGGAGIQADLKAFAANGVHGLSALAALTAQHTRGETVARALEKHRPPHVVLDPVMVATSGARLLEEDALHALRTRLLPLATVATPNLPEAELLLGRKIPDLEAMAEAAAALRALGASAVLLKGGHLQGGGEVVDILADAEGELRTAHPRLALDAHGTGCTLACTAAVDYVHAALRAHYRPGRGDVAVLDHFATLPGR